MMNEEPKNTNKLFNDLFKNVPPLMDLPNQDINKTETSSIFNANTVANDKCSVGVKQDVLQDDDCQSVDILELTLANMESSLPTNQLAPLSFDVNLGAVLISKCPEKYKAVDISIPGGWYRFLSIGLIVAGLVSDCQLEAYQICLGYTTGALCLQSDFEIRGIPNIVTIIDDIFEKSTRVDVKVDLINSSCDINPIDNYFWLFYLSYIKDNKREYVKCYVHGDCANGMRIVSDGFVTQISKAQMEVELQYFKQCRQKSELVSAISNYMGAEDFEKMQLFLENRNIKLSEMSLTTIIKDAVKTVSQLDNEKK